MKVVCFVIFADIDRCSLTFKTMPINVWWMKIFRQVPIITTGKTTTLEMLRFVTTQLIFCFVPYDSSNKLRDWLGEERMRQFTPLITQLIFCEESLA